MNATDKYGFLIRRENDNGTSRVVAEIVVREDGKDHPVNPSTHNWDDDMPKHLRGMAMDGLAMRGFVSDLDEMPFIGFEPGYFNLYCISKLNAERMVKALALIEKRIRRDEAYSAVDQFVSICAALKLDFVVQQIENNPTHSSWRRSGFYHEYRWNWMTTAGGRNAYARLIREARNEARAHKQLAPVTD